MRRLAIRLLHVLPLLGAIPAAHGAALLEPSRFGAVGDGRSHVLGRAYGDDLAALGAYSRSGAHPFSWVLDPAYGLRFARATSRSGRDLPAAVLQLQDERGSVSNSAQAIRGGMLAAGPCLPPGDRVVAAGGAGQVTLSQAPTTRCAAGTMIRFELAPLQVQALQADWLGIQAAIAAAQQQPTGGAVHVPAGAYLVDRPLVNASGTRNGPPVGDVDEYGDGASETRLIFTADSGPGTCGLGEADRGVGSSARTSIRDLSLVGPGRRGALGTAPSGMDGFCIGAKQLLRRVRADLFHAGVNVLEDHWQIEQSEFSNNLYGIYLAPGGDTFGNGVLRDVFPGGNLLASIAVSSSNVLDSAVLQNVHVGFEPYGFYREAAPPGGVVLGGFISNSLLEAIWGESLGNGYIYGANGSRDRVEHDVWIGDSPGMDPTGRFRDPARPAEALVDVGAWWGNDMISSDFGNPENYRLVARALIQARDAIQGNAFGRAPDMVAASSAAKPALRAPVMLFNRFETGQASGHWRTAASALAAGALVSGAGHDQVVPAASGAPIEGVAMAAADAGGAVPVADAGMVTAAKAATQVRRGQPLGPDAGDPGRLAPAAAGTSTRITAWDDAPATGATALVSLGPD